MLQKISPLQKCQEELGSLKAELEEKKVCELTVQPRPVRMGGQRCGRELRLPCCSCALNSLP